MLSVKSFNVLFRLALWLHPHKGNKKNEIDINVANLLYGIVIMYFLTNL